MSLSFDRPHVEKWEPTKSIKYKWERFDSHSSQNSTTTYPGKFNSDELNSIFGLIRHVRCF